MKKKIIFFDIPDGKSWIGGIYYLKNIIFVISQNDWIRKNYELVVRARENVQIFNDFKDNTFIKIVRIKNAHKLAKEFDLLGRLCFGNVRYMYNVIGKKRSSLLKLFGATPISWIPDFQHNYYPEFFSDEEIKFRTERYSHIQKSDLPLVLSSNTCKSDFEEFYGHKSNVYVVPFVSYIEPELKQITAELENKTLLKYDILRGKYACISNQFWQHKNHIVVLKAIKRLHSKLGDFKFVFTGYPKDYRNPDYYNLLMEYIQDPEVAPHIKVLGFVERVEQLIVMKNSRFIIQPSLFEGWGTVVEDAKVLDKNMLLSDIPVHREQMNNKCVLFVPHDDEALAAIISDMLNKEYTDDIQVGLKDMYARAKMYSEGFERLLINEGK